MWSSGKIDPLAVSKDILAGRPLEELELGSAVSNQLENISGTKTGEVAASPLSPDDRATFANKTRGGFQTSGLFAPRASKWTPDNQSESFAQVVAAMFNGGGQSLDDAISLLLDGIFEPVYRDEAKVGRIARDDGKMLVS